MVRCDNEEATRKYQVFCKKNEIVRKHIRKYRARYWAVNQIEDTNLEEENQDIVGDLLDNKLVATTLGDVVPEPSLDPGSTSANNEETSGVSAANALTSATEEGGPSEPKLSLTQEPGREGSATVAPDTASSAPAMADGA